MKTKYLNKSYITKLSINGKSIWYADWINGQIKKTTDDDSNPSDDTIISNGHVEITNIVYDPESEHIYWAADNKLYKAHYDTNAVTVLNIEASGIKSISLHSETQSIYFVNGKSQLKRYNISNDQTEIINNLSSNVKVMQYDYSYNELYYITTIKTGLYSSRETIIEDESFNITDFQIIGTQIYFINDGELWRCNNDGSNLTQILEINYDYDFKIQNFKILDDLLYCSVIIGPGPDWFTNPTETGDRTGYLYGISIIDLNDGSIIKLTEHGTLNSELIDQEEPNSAPNYIAIYEPKDTNTLTNTPYIITTNVDKLTLVPLTDLPIEIGTKYEYTLINDIFTYIRCVALDHRTILYDNEQIKQYYIGCGDSSTYPTANSIRLGYSIGNYTSELTKIQTPTSLTVDNVNNVIYYTSVNGLYSIDLDTLKSTALINPCLRLTNLQNCLNDSKKNSIFWTCLDRNNMPSLYRGTWIESQFRYFQISQYIIVDNNYIYPKHIAIDDNLSNIYIMDENKSLIAVITYDGVQLDAINKPVGAISMRYHNGYLYFNTTEAIIKTNLNGENSVEVMTGTFDPNFYIA